MRPKRVYSPAYRTPAQAEGHRARLWRRSVVRAAWLLTRSRRSKAWKSNSRTKTATCRICATRLRASVTRSVPTTVLNSFTKRKPRWTASFSRAARICRPSSRTCRQRSAFSTVTRSTTSQYLISTLSFGIERMSCCRGRGARLPETKKYSMLDSKSRRSNRRGTRLVESSISWWGSPSSKKLLRIRTRTIRRWMTSNQRAKTKTEKSRNSGGACCDRRKL